MLETKQVVAVLESLRVEPDVNLAASIVRAHLAAGRTEIDEGLIRKYLIDGGTEIPAEEGDGSHAGDAGLEGQLTDKELSVDASEDPEVE